MSASSSSGNFKIDYNQTKVERTSSGIRVSSQGYAASVQSFSNENDLPALTTSTGFLLQKPNQTEVCQGDYPSLEGVIAVRNGKFVRDECVDTHNILNEPGGVIVNLLSRHGLTADSTDLRIHLGIRQFQKIPVDYDSYPVSVCPGTITLTDDYAREIFKGMMSTSGLKSVVACLEIDDNVDSYELKKCQDMSANFLSQFLSIYPTTLTKFHVEIPGMSALYLPEWKFLLDQQTCLQILICNFGVVLWKFYENCIGRNTKTLERVILRRLQTYDITAGRYTPMDWEMFSPCENLQYLKITCGYRSNFHEYFSPPPPTTVFLHENLEKLPKASMCELHLGKIWVEPCLLQNFCSARPNLVVCKDCNDNEYYDGDLPEREKRLGLCQGRIISTSTIDIVAEFRPEKRTADDKQLTTIVLALFLVILIALLVLFVVIYFGHWKSNHPHRANSTIIPSTPTENPNATIIIEIVP